MKYSFFILLLLVSVGFSLPTPITNCTDPSAVINSPGSYDFTPSLPDSFFGAPNSFGSQNACIIINSSNVSLSCQGYSLVDNGTSNSVGILSTSNSSNHFENITILDCPTIANYSTGINLGYLDSGSITNSSVSNSTYSGFSFTVVSNFSISNSTAFNNSIDGFRIYQSNLMNISNTTSYDNVGTAISVTDSGNISVFDNTAYGNHFGVFVFSALSSYGSNNISSNSFYNNSWAGVIVVNSNSNTISNNTIHNSSFYGGIRVSGSQNNSIFENILSNNSYGLILIASNYTSIYQNLAYGNSLDGFYLANSSSNPVSANNASGNVVNGFYISNSSNISLDSNHAYNSGNNGFRFTTVNYTNITNNLVNNSSNYGILVDLSSYVMTANNNISFSNFYGLSGEHSHNLNFSSNYVSNSNVDGISFYVTTNSLIENNTITASGYNGIDLQSSGSNNTVASNNISLSSTYAAGNGGIRIYDSDTTLLSLNYMFDNYKAGLYFDNSIVTGSSNIYQNNSFDILINDTYSLNKSLFLISNIMDNPNGGLVNYSNFSINDVISPFESYSISWATNSSPLPGSYVTVANQNVNITNYSSDASIDQWGFNWLDSDSAGRHEELFQILFYDGTWYGLSPYVNQSINEIYTLNSSGFGVYSLAEAPFTNPPVSSGSSSSTPALRISLDMQCNNNTITTSVSSVSVNVIDENTGSSVYSGTTDSDGHAMFNSCGRNVRVYANRDGYRSTDERFTLNSCTCLGTEVPPVVTPPAPAPTPTTQPAPPVTNTTTPMNNTPAPTPQPTPAAPVFTGPSSGTVGSSLTFSVTNCEDCSVRVEGPDGRIVTLTVTNGAINLPITASGNYRLSLVRNGEVVRSLSMAATSPTNVTPSPSAPPVPGESGDNGFAILIIIILVVIGGVAYYYMSQRR